MSRLMSRKLAMIYNISGKGMGTRSLKDDRVDTFFLEALSVRSPTTLPTSMLNSPGDKKQPGSQLSNFLRQAYHRLSYE